MHVAPEKGASPFRKNNLQKTRIFRGNFTVLFAGVAICLHYIHSNTTPISRFGVIADCISLQVIKITSNQVTPHKI